MYLELRQKKSTKSKLTLIYWSNPLIPIDRNSIKRTSKIRNSKTKLIDSWLKMSSFKIDLKINFNLFRTILKESLSKKMSKSGFSHLTDKKINFFLKKPSLKIRVEWNMNFNNSKYNLSIWNLIMKQKLINLETTYLQKQKI